MALLFEPLTLRGTTLRNRVVVSPMCMYSSDDGHPSDWHLVHLGSFARGGAGLVFTEATAVTPEGRISSYDAGIWSDDHDYSRITAFVHGQGATPGIQLAHAGRKASVQRPWHGHDYVGPDAGGWETVGPSALAFDGLPVPHELTTDEIAGLVRAFGDATRRAAAQGFQVVELHGAHGYLVHEFLSPLSNTRTDRYGGELANRARFLLEVVDAMRAALPDTSALLVRVSATDWAEGGWTLEECVEVCRWLREHGVDLVDVSSGGNVPQQRITVGPGYQVPFARAIRQGTGMPTGAVGLLTSAAQAEQVLVEGSADVVLLARALLRDPHWTLAAAHELRAEVRWPEQYLRARPR